jgi:hypothetical protein
MPVMRLRFAEWGWSRLTASEMVRLLRVFRLGPDWLFQDVHAILPDLSTAGSSGGALPPTLQPPAPPGRSSSKESRP